MKANKTIFKIIFTYYGAKYSQKTGTRFLRCYVHQTEVYVACVEKGKYSSGFMQLEEQSHA